MNTTVSLLHGEEDITWYEEAARELRHSLKEQGFYGALRAAVRTESFWKSQHFLTGMQVRNELRRLGHGEGDHSIRNLDDHYVCIMLLALGIEIEPEQVWPNIKISDMVSLIKEKMDGR